LVSSQREELNKKSTSNREKLPAIKQKPPIVNKSSRPQVAKEDDDL